MKGKYLIFSALCAVSLAGSLTGCSAVSFDNTKLIVGMECGYAPFNWTETVSGAYTLPITNATGYADGYDVQIAKYLGEELGVPVEIKKLTWEALLTSMTTGDINCIIAGMSYSEERDLTIDFTQNYYTSQMTVVVRADSALTEISSIQELSGYKVVSQRGTLTDTIIDQIDGVIHSSALDSFDIAALAVASGTADAMTAEYPVARSIVNANPSLAIVTFSSEYGFQNLDENELGVAVGVQEGNRELQDAINGALDRLSPERRTELMDQAIARAPGADAE